MKKIKVLNEPISRENVLVVSGILAQQTTKMLINKMGEFAIRAHKILCHDISQSNIQFGYIPSEYYDLVQEIGLYLCQNFGKMLDDIDHFDKNGKPVFIYMQAKRLAIRIMDRRYRNIARKVDIEDLTENNEPLVELPDYTTEESFAIVDKIIEPLNLTEREKTILNCRINGSSFPETARVIDMALSSTFRNWKKIKSKYFSYYK